MYQAQEKTGELIHAINEMVLSGPDPERVAALAPGLESLRKGNLHYQALQLEGMIAALEGDIERTEYKFRLSRNACGGGTPMLLINHATAMINVMDFVRATEIANEVVERAPDNVGYLRGAFKIHCDANNSEGASQLLHRLESLGVDCSSDRKVFAQLARKMNKISVCGGNWLQMAERAKEISQVLIANGFGHPKLIEEELHDEIIMMFCLHSLDPKHIALAESLVHRSVASSHYLPVDSAIAYICGSVKDHHVYSAE